MEQVAALLLIVGCNADSSSCQEIPVPTPIYQSIRECETARPLTMRMSGAEQNELFARCAPIESNLEDKPVTIAWTISKGGELSVELKDAANLVASR